MKTEGWLTSSISGTVLTDMTLDFRRLKGVEAAVLGFELIGSGMVDISWFRSRSRVDLSSVIADVLRSPCRVESRYEPEVGEIKSESCVFLRGTRLAFS